MSDICWRVVSWRVASRVDIILRWTKIFTSYLHRLPAHPYASATPFNSSLTMLLPHLLQLVGMSGSRCIRGTCRHYLDRVRDRQSPFLGEFISFWEKVPFVLVLIEKAWVLACCLTCYSRASAVGSIVTLGMLWPCSELFESLREEKKEKRRKQRGRKENE